MRRQYPVSVNENTLACGEGVLRRLIRRHMKRHGYAIAAALSLLASGALAQAQAGLPKVGDTVTQVFAVPPKDGEFRKDMASGGIGCIKVGSPPEAEGYGHCLKFGSASLGMAFDQLQALLSKDKRIPQASIVNARIVRTSPEGVRTVLIPTRATESGGQLRMQSYLVATVLASGQVDSLQLTGLPGEATEDLPFSGIKLGAPRKRVVDTLGPPSSVADVAQIKGTRWDYAPFPFSIEFVNGVVYSMRIHRPSREALQRAFVPLSTAPN